MMIPMQEIYDAPANAGTGDNLTIHRSLGGAVSIGLFSDRFQLTLMNGSASVRLSRQFFDTSHVRAIAKALNDAADEIDKENEEGFDDENGR